MRAFWIWALVCGALVGLAFVGLPAWDTEAEGFEIFSGAELFVGVVILVPVLWGFGLLLIVFASGLAARLDATRARAWLERQGPSAKASLALFGAAVLVAIALGASRLADSGGGGTSDFVSFDTADADPDWSPDGRWIAFSGRGGVSVIRPDGTGLRRMYRGEAWDPDWSPDGRAIAFTSPRGIAVVRVREGSTRLVVRGAAFSRPAWAPDGRALAVVKEERGVFATSDGRISASSPAIYVVAVDSGRLRRLLPRYRGAAGGARPGSVAAVSESEPTWSPDGSRIAFQAADGIIAVVAVAGGRRTAVNERAGYEPAWSPDGRLIAYQCEGDVCVALAGGGDERRLAGGGGDPSWSPDSRYLVFERYLYGGSYYGSSPSSLSIVDVREGAVRDLTYGP